MWSAFPRIRTVLCLSVLALAVPVSASEVTSRGSGSTRAVELEWDDLTGGRFSLDSLRGRVTVLNFWATWCKPCVEEMPVLVRIQAEWGMLGVQVVGASADEAQAADKVRRFARRHDITFPVLLGATTEQMTALGLPPSLPGTVILDRDGKVVRRYPGVIQRREVEGALRELLDAEPSDSAEASATAEPDNHREVGAHDHQHATSTQASLVPS